MSYSAMPVQQHAFEEICTYLMSHIISKESGHAVKYRLLGSAGQSQWGLDVVTDHPKFAAFVGQCKHKRPGSRLTFSDVFNELKKSDNYEQPIKRFFFLTNSERDSQLQTKLVGYEYTRPDGAKFPVKLVYWDDLTDLSFIPKDKLRLYFPEQAYHARHFLPPTNMEAVAVAYEIAPQVLHYWFSNADINYIHNSSVNLHLPEYLWHKINLFLQAVDGAKLFRWGLSIYGEKPCVRQLFRALPAIESFFAALINYKKEYADVHGLDPSNPQLINRCQEVQNLANTVINNYNYICNGDMEWDNELASLKKYYNDGNSGPYNY